ncbi:uncharacterized protein [Antedon mediterranea]|uniref:uncharacterized protein n=1 Tax=Antedon mediterranea TaxID=105859 RepID=UPI003AF9574E
MSKSIDINYSTARGLCKIPGVDPVLAKRIITYRRKLCGFDSIDQLMQVSGLTRGKYKKIADNAFVGKKQTPSKLHNSRPTPKQNSKNKTVEWNLEDNLIIPIRSTPRPNRKSSRNSSKKVSITQPTDSMVQDVGTQYYKNGTRKCATGTKKPNKQTVAKQRRPNRLADETLQTPIMNFYISPGQSGHISGQPMSGQTQTGQLLPGNLPSGQQSTFLNTSTFPYSPTPLQFGNNPKDFKHVYSFDKEDYYTFQPSSTYDTENIKEHTTPKTPQAQTEQQSREESFDFSNNLMFTKPLTSSTPKKRRKRQNKRRNQDISANSNDYSEYKDVQTNSDNNQNVSNDLQIINESDNKARGIYKENCNAIKQWLRGVAPYVFSDYETTATTDSEVDLKQQEQSANSTSKRVKHRRKTRSKSKPSERHTTQCTCANERKEKRNLKQHKEKRNTEDEDNIKNQYVNSWPCVLM